MGKSISMHVRRFETHKEIMILMYTSIVNDIYYVLGFEKRYIFAHLQTSKACSSIWFGKSL